jgi:hypothetical protein
MRLLLSIILLLGFVSGCKEAPAPEPKNPRPDWISNHDVGAVGICGPHLRGNAAQEEVAYDRALKKLAKQKAASVKTESVGSQHEKIGRYSSTYDSQTTVSASATVSAQEKGTWRDPRTNIFYIWLAPK